MTNDVRRALVAIVAVLTLTNILSLCAIFYVKSQGVKSIAATTLAEPGSTPDMPPNPNGAPMGGGPVAGAPPSMPAVPPDPMQRAPKGKPTPRKAPTPAAMPAPQVPVSGPATPDPASGPSNPMAAPPAGAPAPGPDGAAPVGQPGGPSLSIWMLPPTEIYYGVMKLQDTDRYKLDAQQAKAAETLLQAMLDRSQTDAMASASFLAMVSTTLTPDQVKAMRGNRTRAGFGMPNADGTDSVTSAVVKLLEDRAGGATGGAANPVMGAGLPIPPEEVMPGLLGLEQTDKLKLSKEQAAKLYPYAKNHAEAEARKVQGKNALLKLLRPDQQDYIMSIHSDSKPVPVTGPQDVLAALRKA